MNRQAFTKRRCCARDSGLGDCEGAIVSSHTISRGPNLAKIAEEGHVIGFSANIKDLIASRGHMSAKLVGIRDASTFNGFCSKHDRELFSCIENEVFVGRPDQCLAVAYRTMCRELYGKEASSHIRDTLRGADKGKVLAEQQMLQKLLDVIDEVFGYSRSEHRETLKILSAAIAGNQPNSIESLIVGFDAPIPFMFAGAWSPFTDLYGQQLQDGSSDELLEQIFVASFAVKRGAIICISWLNTGNAPGRVIARQIAEQSPEARASACLQLVAKHTENIFFRPSWYQDLDTIQLEQLENLVHDGLDILGSVPSWPVKPEIDYGLPIAVEISAV